MAFELKHLLSHKHISGQMVRYGLISGVGLAADFGTLVFVKQVLGLYYLIGICAGFIVGLIITYILSNKFVFGQPKMNKHKAFLLFGLIGAVGLLTLNLVVWVLTSELKVNYLISKTIATFFVFLWNFGARRTLYSERDRKKAPAPAL